MEKMKVEKNIAEIVKKNNEILDKELLKLYPLDPKSESSSFSFSIAELVKSNLSVNLSE